MEEVNALITLSNGHRFEYMIASGGLGYDGLGWWWERPLVRVGIIDPSLFTVVIKSLTYSPILGNLRWYNPFRCVRPLGNPFWPDGVVNAVGLSNPGFEWWCKKVAPNVDFSWQKLVASVSPEGSTVDQFAEMVSRLSQFRFAAIELNTSCPNVADYSAEEVVEYTNVAKEATHKPLILKLSAAQDVNAIIPAVEDDIEAVSINAVPWELAFPGQRSPLAHLGGGAVSGKPAQPQNWNLLSWLKFASTVPVIGPDIWEYSDIADLEGLGADTFSFGALQLCYPWRPTAYARRRRRAIAYIRWRMQGKVRTLRGTT